MAHVLDITFEPISMGSDVTSTIKDTTMKLDIWEFSTDAEGFVLANGPYNKNASRVFNESDIAVSLMIDGLNDGDIVCDNVLYKFDSDLELYVCEDRKLRHTYELNRYLGLDTSSIVGPIKRFFMKLRNM